ncbi:Uncharacterised protein [Mycobacteroides abscessus]|nr:Uncharacterised protein [Mycobacteroides abscessus]
MCLIEQVIITFKFGHTEIHVPGLFGPEQLTRAT